MKNKSATVDRVWNSYPRSKIPRLPLFTCFLVFVLAACQSSTPTVTLAILGDLMLGRGVNPQPNSLAALEPDLSRADLALANLESPLASVQTGLDSPYNLCAMSNNAQMLDDWGFDLLSIANNHSLDCGPGGLGETLSALQSVGITPLDQGMVPVFMEVNSLQLAFLSFDDISSTIDTIKAVKAIQLAKQAGAMVVVSIHWGAEYQGGASGRQKSLAAQFAEAGASLIWGHHPHVLQPAEWIETSQDKTLVFYSLGNALFDQDGMEDTRQSAMVLVTLDTHGITSVRSLPFLIDIGDSRVVQPDPENAAKIQDRIKIP